MLDSPALRSYDCLMDEITEDLSFTDEYGIEKLGAGDSVCFFDIETTGMKSASCMIYLIGCVWRDREGWHMKQWFAPDARSEADILRAFLSFAAGFKAIVHFNGDAFDIPYVRTRAALYGISADHLPAESIDILKRIRKYKARLGLENCRQKTIETFLGISREDECGGGELIPVYYAYTRTRDPKKRDLLLLHNADDVKGLPRVLNVLSYCDFFEGPFTLASERARDGVLTLGCSSPTRLPVPCAFDSLGYRVYCHENIMDVSIPLCSTTLKYFFPDPGEYYYLPLEDMAIHKSVAVYVDKEHRQKATARTCYQKASGDFFVFPKCKDLDIPLFYTEYKKQPSYAQYREGMFKDSRLLDIFTKNLLA